MARYQQRALTGERNQCPACGEYFETTAAFDAHRTGRFATLAHVVSVRYCLSVDAMHAKGMRMNSTGYWVVAGSHARASATPAGDRATCAAGIGSLT